MTRPAPSPTTLMALTALLGLMPAPSLSQPLISLPLGPGAQLSGARYRCDDGRQAAVTYVTSGADALALIDLDAAGDVGGNGADDRADDGPRVFVNVIAASGARYVAGALEWWIKGDQASLSDAMSDADPVTCRVQDAGDAAP